MRSSSGTSFEHADFMVCFSRFYWLTLHNCITMHSTKKHKVTAYIKSYLIICHHSVYCLHPGVFHEEGLYRGIRGLTINVANSSR